MDGLNYYQSTTINAQRQREMIKEADAQRLAAEIRTAKIEKADNTAPVYAPLLASAGRKMVEIGGQLQARYGKAVEAVNQPSVNQPTTSQTPATNLR